jgi:putative ABC transport system permease protein
MLRLTLKGSWQHRRRLVGTVLAIFLGVAFLSGTLALGDTLERNFETLFLDASSGTDTIVRRATKIDAEVPTDRGLIDESLLADVREVDGVAAAEPSIQAFGRLVGKDGEPIGGNGPPTFAGNWIDDPKLNPYRLDEGHAPRRPGEAVINRGAAEEGDLGIGDTTVLQTPEPLEIRIVGLASFGSEAGFGSVTFAGLTLESAQQDVTKAPGKVTSILVRAEPGAGEHELTRRIQDVLPEGVEAVSSEALVTENLADINADFLDILRTILVAFAAIALLVATFSIYNTFSIIVAQRTRESALMRAVGATRGQLLAATVIEALAVGVAASVAGLFGGLGIATLLKVLMSTLGPGTLPDGGLELATRTIVLSLSVGVLVTLLAAIAPALRASRVPPLAAIRDVAVERVGATRARTIVGAVLLAVGVGAVVSSTVAVDDPLLMVTMLGGLLTLAGVIVAGPIVARFATRVIGAVPVRLRGITASLARQNAMRNPRRTAATSSALLVGVAVVALFTVFASSLKASVDDSVAGSLEADLVVSSGGFDSQISPALADAVGDLAEVSDAVGLGIGGVNIGGEGEQLTVIDPSRLPAVLDVNVARGSLESLSPSQLAVDDGNAKDNDWRIGSPVEVEFVDGQTERLTVGAIYESDEFLSGYALSREAWAPHAVQDIDSTLLVKLRDGVEESEGARAVTRVAEGFGSPDVLTREQYVEDIAARIDTMLGLVYVMLALAVLIALMGIANTLSLSIYERTRELGLLRAVGETRAQLRSMVRWESVIIAVFGTLGGLGLGVFLGWGFFEAAATDDLGTFAAPVGQLVVVLVVGAIAGVLAGIRPARRAARLDVLAAIATE